MIYWLNLIEKTALEGHQLKKTIVIILSLFENKLESEKLEMMRIVYFIQQKKTQCKFMRFFYMSQI